MPWQKPLPLLWNWKFNYWSFLLAWNIWFVWNSDLPSTHVYVARGNKGNQTCFGVFKVFWCKASSQHDGYHVGSSFQGIAHSGKLGGMRECNPIGIWIWCQGGYSSFDGMFWSAKSCCWYICYCSNWCCTTRTWKKHVWGWGINWKIFSNISH